MRIVVLGRIGVGDVGEEATVGCSVRGLRARNPNVAVTLASFAPDAHRHLDVTVVAADDDRMTAVIAEADAVMVVGDGLWTDGPDWRLAALFGAPTSAPIACVSRPLLTAAALGVPSVLFGNAVGPLRTPEAARAVAFLCSLATQVSVRDDESAATLRAAGFAGGLTVCADPTFTLVPDASASVAARRKPLRIGVAPGALADGAASIDLPAALAGALRELADRHAAEVAVIAMAGTDPEAARMEAKIVEYLGASSSLTPDDVLVVRPATAEAAAAWFGSCDAVVAMRVPDVILAAVAGAPSLILAVASGLQSHATSLGLSDLVLQPAECTSRAIQQRLQDLLSARDAIGSQLGARVEVARTMLEAAYDAVFTSAAGASSHPSFGNDDGKLAAYERLCGRLRARLEEREESWRTLTAFLGREAETVAPVSSGGPQRGRDIHMLKKRVLAAESELDAIKRSRGWRMLHRYGVFKHQYLLPISRFFGRGRRDRDTAPASTDDPAPGVLPPGTFDVVCFPIIDWDFRYQRPQQLMARFARAGHRVFYIAPRFLEPGAAPAVVEKMPNVHHVTLSGPSRNVWTEALDAKSTEGLFGALDRLRIDWGLGATLVCVELPFWWPLAARARERFAWPILYDCMDHHAGFSTYTGATDRHEEELFTGADLVVASSPLLLERAQRHTDRAMLVRNGCDFEHFAAALGSRAAPARPVIGFYGAIADWFDGDLVADLAERRPDWDFVLVGSTDMGDVTRLAALPNVRLPGEQPYANLPGWLATFDVTVLPFKRTPLTEATNPVKTYEILAAGKPLVSVPLPEMRAIAAQEGLVRLAATAADFEREITAALLPEDRRHVAARQAFARANTWEARYDTLAPIVPTLFPRASTVIVTYNNLAMTKACLASLWTRTEWPSHEVIVVDNASTDGTRAFLEQLAAERADLIAICNDRNLGFAAACNQGLARASGSYLVLLNNDTVVTRGWLSTLIRHLHAVPEIGLIGPLTNEIGNEAKVDVGYADLAAMPAWAARFTRANANSLRSMRMLAMFCVAMRRDTYEEIGPLDERFAIGMFEDDDYSRRMKRAGYGVVTAGDVFVHHVGGASFKRLDRERYRELFERNRALYESKWGPWTAHQDDATRPQVTRLRERLVTIVGAARVGPGEIVVFLPVPQASSPEPDRVRRLAAALARNGLLVFLDGDNGEPDTGDGFREIADNLWGYRGPRGTLERLEAPLVWVSACNALGAFRWLARTIVYDVSEESGDPACRPEIQRENHERMLREADLVVCTSRTVALEAAARRPDIVHLPIPADVASEADGGDATWERFGRVLGALLASRRADGSHRASESRRADAPLDQP